MKEMGAVGKGAGVGDLVTNVPVRCAALRNPGHGSRKLEG
jgi:hypothetical protein